MDLVVVWVVEIDVVSDLGIGLTRFQCRDQNSIGFLWGSELT